MEHHIIKNTADSKKEQSMKDIIIHWMRVEKPKSPVARKKEIVGKRREKTFEEMVAQNVYKLEKI